MNWEIIPGWFDFQNVYDLALSQSEPGDRLVEVGVFLGRSLSYLSQRARELGKDVRVYGVDTFRGSGDSDPQWEEESAAKDGAGLVGFAVWRERAVTLPDLRLLVMDSVEAAAMFRDGSCRLVFLDGDHSYGGFTQDLDAWWPKVKLGGIFAGHDYYPTEREGIAVARALQDWTSDLGLTFQTEGNSWWAYC